MPSLKQIEIEKTLIEEKKRASVGGGSDQEKRAAQMERYGKRRGLFVRAET
jgi:hypothetical protein